MARVKNTNVSNVKKVEDPASFKKKRAQNKSEKKPRMTKFYTHDIKKLLKDLSEMRDKLVKEIEQSSEVTEDHKCDNMSEPASNPISEPEEEFLQDEFLISEFIASGVNSLLIEHKEGV
jgi:hypothetical protein